MLILYLIVLQIIKNNQDQMYSNYVVRKIFLVFLLLLISCNINPTYRVTGIILEKNPENNSMLIDHDKIEG